MDQDEKLKRHLIDLSRQASSRCSYTYSAFLSLPEQELFRSAAKDLAPVRTELFGGNELSERRIAVFGSEEDFGYREDPPVSVLRISPVSEKFGEELSHRDYLGAVLSLGIDRSLTGDIVVRGKTAFLYVLDSIRDYISENLTRTSGRSLSAGIFRSSFRNLRHSG